MSGGVVSRRRNLHGGVGKVRKAPEPVGYDPYIIPMWKDGPTSDEFAVLRLSPYRLRVMAGTVMMKGEGAALRWTAK